MLRTKRIITGLLVCILAVVAPLSVYAGELFVTPVRQAMSYWCWAACDQMAGDYEVQGSARTQYDIVQYVKGFVVNEPATITETALGAEYVTYDYADYTPTTSQFTETQVEYFINTLGNPFICGVVGSNWAHMIVVAGYDAGDVKVIDPWTGSITWMDYSDLQTWDGGTWQVTIYTTF